MHQTSRCAGSYVIPGNGIGSINQFMIARHTQLQVALMLVTLILSPYQNRIWAETKNGVKSPARLAKKVSNQRTKDSEPE